MENNFINNKPVSRFKTDKLFLVLGILFLLTLGGLAYWDTIKPTPVEKIGLSNIQGHREYQDSILSSLDSTNTLAGYRDLRGQYLKWMNRSPEIQNTEEYYYYMLRLYSKISGIRFSGLFYDTVNKKMNYAEEYKNIYDSLYNYYDLLISKNKSHKIADNFMSEAFHYESVRYRIDTGQVPFSLKRNYNTLNRLISAVINNSINYYNYDTSTNKVYSRSSIEFSYAMLSSSIDFNAPLKDDASLQNLDYLGKLWEIIAKYKSKDFVLIEYNRQYVNKYDYPKILAARQRIKYLEELKNRPQCYDDVRAYEFGREMATMVRLGSYNLESAIEEYFSSNGLASPYESTHPCVQKGYEDAMNNIESPFNKEGKSWTLF